MADELTYARIIAEQIDSDRDSRRLKGYEFRERTVATHTIGDFVRAVLTIHDAEVALRFYEGCVIHLQEKQQITPDEAIQAARSNIGFCFGEGMAPEDISMWRRICQADHPWFSTAVLTNQQLFGLGAEHAGGERG